MTQLSKEIFFKYYSFGREDNGWDYKEDINISNKTDFYNFIRDILAFSNYGGGYLLLGIRDQSLELVGVKNVFDEADLGSKIEKYLGFSINLEVFYFNQNYGDKSINLGVIYISPSVDILVCPKTLNDSSNKSVIREGEILYRRNTRSVWANKDDVRNIIERIYNAKSKIVSDLNSDSELNLIYQNNRYTRDIYDVLLNKYQFNSFEFGVKLKEIWQNQVSYSKAEFARMLDIPMDIIESCFNGYQLPDINIILKATKLFNLPRDFFFHPSINLRYPFWKEDLIKYVILSLVRPKENISSVDNDGQFYSSIIYDLAVNIEKLYEWLYDDYDKVNVHLWNEYVNGLSDEKLNYLKDDLSRQYYKVIEQYPVNSTDKSLPVSGNIIKRWFNASDKHIARIIIESISKIELKNPDNPKIYYRFVEDIKKRKVKFKAYNRVNLKMENS